MKKSRYRELLKTINKAYAERLCWLRESTRIRGLWKGLILKAA